MNKINKINIHKYMFGGKKVKKIKFTGDKKSSKKSKSSKILSNILNTSSKIIGSNKSTGNTNPITPITESNISVTEHPKEKEITKTTSGIIKGFFSSSFMSFMKNYFFFIIFFSICFFVILNVFNDTNNHITVTETKVLFYLIIAFLFIIINDLMSIPLQWLDKFFIVIIFSLIIEYIILHFIEKRYPNDPFHKKLMKVVISSLIVSFIFSIIIYFQFQLKSQKITSQLINSFNYAISKNAFFLCYITFYLIFFYYVYFFLNLNSFLGDILSPTILGSIVLFMIFSFIIYVILRLKIINKLQILNSFISLYAILFFLGIVFIYIFMNSVSTICTTNISESQMKRNDLVTLLILISIFIILWYDDSRNWHQKGSILFIFATIVAFYTFFFYSIQYPNMAMISLWLFIEWLIIFFKRNENSKNSFNFSFMNT